MKKVIIAFTMVLLSLPAFSQTSKTKLRADDELQKHLERRGQAFLRKYIASTGGTADAGEWKPAIDRALIKLARASGNSPFSISYIIVKDKSFNALALPGGQIVIHEGVLIDLESRAAKKIAAGGAEAKKKGMDRYREELLVPILAHELAHYYNKHSLNSVKKYWSLRSGKEGRESLELFKYTQELERDADLTGSLIMQKAGYDPEGMAELLTMLNEIEQTLRKENKTVPFYFASHPSPHARLAALPHRGQDLHRFAARLEWAFDSIQMGKNLDRARDLLADALKKYPGNYYLLKADAVACHKAWLATVPLGRQRLKSTVTLPSYRDEMTAAGTRRTRGKATAGSMRLYEEAIKAYRLLDGIEDDPEALSNFAVLMAYSDDPAEKNEACGMAQSAVKVRPAPWIYSNLAVTLFMAGKADEAVQLLAPAVSLIDQGMQTRLSAAAVNPAGTGELARMNEYMKNCQLIDRDYVNADFTPLLNLALILSSKGDTEQASLLAGAYFERYDSSSAWARHLSEVTKVPIKDSGKDQRVFAVNGIRAGDTLESVINRLGKAPRIEEYAGTEQWLYPNGLVLIMEEGTIVQMAIIGGDALVNGSFGIGTLRAEVEKTLGAPSGRSGDYLIYGKGGRVYITYSKDRADKLILVP